MKHGYYLLVILLLHPSFSNGQRVQGSYGIQKKVVKNKHPVIQDGNDVLGQTYNNTACGLNYVQASQKLGKRFHTATGSSCIPVDGPTQPATLAISGIPTCSVIDK